MGIADIAVEADGHLDVHFINPTPVHEGVDNV
jgi:hypothetical protein